MKLHLALAGLALISPFSTVAQTSSIGVALTLPDVIIPGKDKTDVAEAVQLGLDAYYALAAAKNADNSQPP